MEFTPALTRIRGLLLLQRTIRMIVRMAWTGLAGFLCAWGLSAAAGLPPDRNAWLWTAAAFALPWLLMLFRPLDPGRLTWRMDRLLGLREQVSTAWMVSRRPGEANPVEDMLVAEAAGLLPGVRDRVVRRGWFLGRDLEALLLVGLLFTAALAVSRAGEGYPSTAMNPLGLPGLGQAPAFTDVFPSGIPGLTEGASGSGSESGAEPQTEDGAGMDALDNILNDLGEALSEHPETADIGEALQNGDLESAAAAIERTADNVDLLPEEARQNMQEALQQAAQQAQEAGQEDLAEDLQAAAQALENPDPNNPLAADALDDLADGLRDLGEAFASMGSPADTDGSVPPENGPQVGSAGGAGGTGSGSGGASQPEPITRLEGEGQDFLIEGGDTPSGLLQPGSSPGTPITISGGSPSVTGGGSGGSTGPVNSILTPYTFPWKWRDVVSDYFSP